MGAEVMPHHFVRPPKMMGVTLILVTLVGCTTTPGGTFCVGKPHRFSDATVNVMTDAEVAQELAHNKQGAALCGWKP